MKQTDQTNGFHEMICCYIKGSNLMYICLKVKQRAGQLKSKFNGKIQMQITKQNLPIQFNQHSLDLNHSINKSMIMNNHKLHNQMS